MQNSRSHFLSLCSLFGALSFLSFSLSITVGEAIAKRFVGADVDGILGSLGERFCVFFFLLDFCELIALWGRNEKGIRYKNSFLVFVAFYIIKRLYLKIGVCCGCSPFSILLFVFLSYSGGLNFGFS